MRRITQYMTIICVLESLFFCSLAAQDAQLYGTTDWDLDGLKGKVKQVQSEYWRFEGMDGLDGGTGLSLDRKIVTRYDERGFRSAIEVWDGGKELSYVTMWKYSSEGRLLAKIVENTHGQEIEREEAVWDGEGRLSRWISRMASGQIQWQCVYRYASSGRPIEMVKNQENGVAFFRTVWTWDERGRMLEQLNEEPPGSSISRTIWKYDEQGRVVEIQKYGRDGSLDLRTLFIWDEHGLKKEERSCDPDGTVVMRIEYLYDAQGHLTGTLSYGYDGKLQSKCHILCDAEGNALKSDVWVVGMEDDREDLRVRTTFVYEYWD